MIDHKEGGTRKEEGYLSRDRCVFPTSATRGRNCSTGDGEMFAAPKTLEAKLGTQPVFKKARCWPGKVQGTRAGQSWWVGPGWGRSRNALLRWLLTTADGTEGDPRALASPQMRLRCGCHT